MASVNPPPYEAADGSAAGPAFSQIYEQVQALLAAGRQEEAVALLLAALSAVLRQSRRLELLLMQLRRAQRGTRSEKISPEQLALLLEELQQLGAAGPEQDATAEALEDEVLADEIERAEEAAQERGERRRPRRQSWHARAGVERQIHHVEVPETERICARCGREQQRIGADITRTLEYVPAHFVEHEHHLEKYACSACKRGVTTAEGPARLIERSAADATVVAQVVVSKYADHTPLERQRRIYDRCGVAIPVSTMADWVAFAGDLVQPLVDVLHARVLQADVVRLDGTGLKVLDPGNPNHVVHATLWCCVGDDRDVVFRYAESAHGASGPWQILRGRRGYIQADASNTFDRLFNGQEASAVEVGCWAHARRDLAALLDTDCRVAYPLQLIRRLYRFEHLAGVQQLTPEQRAALRGERSAGVLEKLKRWLVATVEKEPPSSELAKAAGYCLNHWTALTRFVQDGRLDLDNNLCERQLRDVALGRKNYLFAGSHQAARRTAAIYSLMRTCAQHGVAPLPYLTDVLRKLADVWPKSRLEELLPDRWQQLHGAASDTKGSRQTADTLSAVTVMV
jgi:transposase